MIAVYSRQRREPLGDRVVVVDVYEDEAGREEFTEPLDWRISGSFITVHLADGLSYYAEEMYGGPGDECVRMTCPHGHGDVPVPFHHFYGSRLEPGESWPVDEDDLFCPVCHTQMEEA